MNKPKVVCFGEVLWDDLPKGKEPGGAPMNVVYHLNKLGIQGKVISRVGDDNDGEKLLDEIKNLILDTAYCQLDQKYPTSNVRIAFDKYHEPSYEIIQPVAWDFIEYEERHSKLLKNSDAFIYGTLSARSETTRYTLKKLLKSAPYKVFDINLRDPFYDRGTIEYLLKEANLLKTNLDELYFLFDWFVDTNNVSEKEKIEILMEKFLIREIIVTKGKRGASYYSQNFNYNSPAPKVKIKDTVGSGDSFLAAFLSKRLKRIAIVEALDFATAIGSYIATQSGACPVYSESDFKNIF